MAISHRACEHVNVLRDKVNPANFLNQYISVAVKIDRVGANFGNGTTLTTKTTTIYLLLTLQHHLTSFTNFSALE